MPVEFQLGDVIRLRKVHPCGSYEWEVVRLGADIGIRCLGCGRRVLLAEDNEINREIAQSLLEERGFAVDAVVNGEDAVRRFVTQAEGTYDVILMDVRMPRKDGLTAAKEIRIADKADARTIPIFAMTANAFEEDIKRSLAAGMDGHLTKPIEPLELYRTLEQALSGDV